MSTVLFYVLFVCKCILYYCHPVSTQLQLNIYHIISYHIISYHIISYHIVSYRIISYHIVSYRIISYHIVSYRIVSYRIVSYHIVSYHISKNINTLCGQNVEVFNPQPVDIKCNLWFLKSTVFTVCTTSGNSRQLSMLPTARIYLFLRKKTAFISFNINQFISLTNTRCVYCQVKT